MSEEAIGVAEPETSAESRFRYDVFISYSHKDEAWVRSEFLPDLEKASLKVVIDTRDSKFRSVRSSGFRHLSDFP